MSVGGEQVLNVKLTAVRLAAITRMRRTPLMLPFESDELNCSRSCCHSFFYLSLSIGLSREEIRNCFLKNVFASKNNRRGLVEPSFV